jgi:hypothetical protein
MLKTKSVSSSSRADRPSRSSSVDRRGERTTGPSGRGCRSHAFGMWVRRDSERSITTATRAAGSATRCSARLGASTSCSTRSTAIRSASSGAEQHNARRIRGCAPGAGSGSRHCRSPIGKHQGIPAVSTRPGLFTTGTTGPHFRNVGAMQSTWWPFPRCSSSSVAQAMGCTSALARRSASVTTLALSRCERSSRGSGGRELRDCSRAQRAGALLLFSSGWGRRGWLVPGRLVGDRGRWLSRPSA